MEQLLLMAATQFGLFTRPQAHKCGVTNRMLQHRVAGGLFEQLPRGVYRICGSEASWRQRVLAACWAGGAYCVASPRTAAVLHGYDTPTTNLVEVSVPRRTRCKNSDAIV